MCAAKADPSSRRSSITPERYGPQLPGASERSPGVFAQRTLKLASSPRAPEAVYDRLFDSRYALRNLFAATTAPVDKQGVAEPGTTWLQMETIAAS